MNIAAKRQTPSPPPKWPAPSIDIDELPVACIEIDDRGVIRYANEAAYILHEIPSTELVGREIWDLLPPDETARSRAAFFANMASGEEPVTVRRSLFNVQGAYRIQEFHRRMLRNPDGTAAGISAIVFDVSQLEAAAQRDKHRAARLESILASLPTAIVVTDSLGFIGYMNQAAEKLTGWLISDLTGNPIEGLFPVSKSTPGASFVLQGGSLDGDIAQALNLLTRAGQYRQVQVKTSPLIDEESGYASGAILELSPRD